MTLCYGVSQRRGTARAGLAALLLACGALAPFRAWAATLEATPSPCEFGDVSVGQAPVRSITVKNVAAADIDILLVNFVMGDAAFSIALDLCSGHTLSPGESSRIDVRFQPTAAGAKTALLGISYRAGSIIGGKSVPLSGTGVAQTRRRTAANTPFAHTTSEPVQLATGELLVDPVADLVLAGPLPIAFVRSYASLLSEDTGVENFGLGPNWIHGYALRLSRVTASEVDVIYHGGQTVRFALDGGEWICVSPSETPFQLRRDDGGDFWLFDPVARLVFQFSGTHHGLLRVMDRNHNTHTLTCAGGQPSGVTDGLGRALAFTYDGDVLSEERKGAYERQRSRFNSACSPCVRCQPVHAPPIAAAST